MEDMRAEQLEALEVLVEYNERVMKNVSILIKELGGERLDDTDKFLEAIIQGINWEVQVLNGTMDVLNEGEVRVDKDAVNTKITALANAISAKDDAKMKDAFCQMQPMLEMIGSAAKAVLA